MTKYLFVFLMVGAAVSVGLKEYHDSNLRFASSIYTKFSESNNGNFLICPLSAQTIISLAAVGAKEATAQQLTTALNIPSDPSEIKTMFQQISSYLDINKDYQLSSANRIYVKENLPLKNDFKTVAQNTFKADIQNINFGNKEKATNEINEWVENKTYNKIKDLLSKDSIKPDTVAMLVNTVYFKGEWVHKFGKPRSMPFYTTETKSVNVDMMTKRNDYNYYFDDNLNVEYLEMPFIGDDVVMTIALPKRRNGLSHLEKSISSVLAEHPYRKLDSIVTVPKFTIETQVDFKSILESLGATLPFTDSANFQGMSDAPLAIDEVVQKAFIEISETGATAAAATKTSFMIVSMPMVDFTADHPFIFYLRHKVHGVFFVGRYMKP